eukprot:4757495-Amphidinium_carterae.1
MEQTRKSCSSSHRLRLRMEIESKLHHLPFGNWIIRVWDLSDQQSGIEVNPDDPLSNPGSTCRNLNYGTNKTLKTLVTLALYM